MNMGRMDVYFGYRTGMRFLRRACANASRVAQPVDNTDLASSARGITAVRQAMGNCEPWILAAIHTEGQLDILVQDARSRHHHPSIEDRCWSWGFPPGSFWRIAPHMLVPSPSMAYLLAARWLGDVELAMLGMELCGGYSYAKDTEAGMVDRAPLITSHELASFVDMFGPVPGSPRARKVAGWLLDNARSPAESELALRLTLPQKYGGYHLRRPVLNPQLSLTANASRIAGQTRVFPDLFWEDARLDVEYEGEVWHQRSLAKDARRRDALVQDGITVISVTKQQKGSAHSFDPVARAIARELGMRAPERSDAAFRKRRSLAEEFSRITWQGEAGRTDV